VQEHLAFDLVAEDLAAGADALTNEARLYAMRNQPRHLESYRYEAEVVRTRERALERVRGLGAAPGELAAIQEAERNLKDLTQIESAAVQAVRQGRASEAQAVLYGPEHERAQTIVLAGLDHFRAMTAARTETAMREARKASDRASGFAKVMLALTALLFLGVLYFVVRRRVSVPLTRMTGIVSRLARQDYDVQVPIDRRRDEIGDMSNAIEVFRQNGLERERLEADRRADQAVKDSILQMMHRLQACQTRQELAEVVACFAPQTFPHLAGRLYVSDDGHGSLSQLSSWQEPSHSDIVVPAGACWGLRRGRAHYSDGQQHDVSCPHISSAGAHTLCIPLTAQGETVGLLYFEERAGAAQPEMAVRLYLELVSDNVALALANMRLRERLASMAVRDALTGLFNRRSLDETLAGHAEAGTENLACIMFDIDHFKRFNDEFGHDAGDAVMQHVAQITQDMLGPSASAYRFGGEEFTVLIEGSDEAAALECAEQIRRQIAASPLAYHGKMLGHVTVSLGLAVAPGDCPVATYCVAPTPPCWKPRRTAAIGPFARTPCRAMRPPPTDNPERRAPVGKAAVEVQPLEGDPHRRRAALGRAVEHRLDSVSGRIEREGGVVALRTCSARSARPSERHEQP
jgi:diguanylate cyclase (GGDEF)-like protein